jgi:hypothetical protein
MGFGWSTAFIQPGIHHSNQRKMLRRGIGPQRIGSYDSAIESGVAKFMVELQKFQGNPNPALLRYVVPESSNLYMCTGADLAISTIGRMVTNFTYGDKLWEEMGDKLTHWNVDCMDLVNEAFFGFWPVDFLHFCKLS